MEGPIFWGLNAALRPSHTRPDLFFFAQVICCEKATLYESSRIFLNLCISESRWLSETGTMSPTRTSSTTMVHKLFVCASKRQLTNKMQNYKNTDLKNTTRLNIADPPLYHYFFWRSWSPENGEYSVSISRKFVSFCFCREFVPWSVWRRLFGTGLIPKHSFAVKRAG